MTYEDALKRKIALGDSYQLDTNMIAKVLVVPNNENDLHNYSVEYRTNNFNDNSAKLYSSDNQFKVCALWTDGVNVVKKVL
jgi:hypothetical protein